MIGKKFETIINTVIILVIVTVVFWLLSHISHVVFLFIGSVLLAYLIKPPVDFLCSYGFNIKSWKTRCACKGLPRTLSILIVYLILLLVIIFFLSFAVPKIQSEAGKFVNNFPQNIVTLQQKLQDLDKWLEPKLPSELHAILYEGVNSSLEELVNSLVNLVKQSFSIIGTIFSTLATILIVPLLAFLLLKDVDNYRQWFLALFPMGWRKEILSILNKIDEGLGGFIRGQILVCICIGFTTIIALYLWGIDYAFLLGTMVGILTIIPFAGPIVGAIPAMILAFAKSPAIALGVLITFIVIHEVEKQLISPALVGRSVGVPTLVILISILIGAELFQFVGVLVAVPFTITLKVIFEYFHQKWAQNWPENKLKEIPSSYETFETSIIQINIDDNSNTEENKEISSNKEIQEESDLSGGIEKNLVMD